MANSLFLPNHTLIAPPPRRLSASVSSKPNKPQPPLLPCPALPPPLGFINFSLTSNSSSSINNPSSGGTSSSRRRAASSFKSRLAPQDSVPPTNSRKESSKSNAGPSGSGGDEEQLPSLKTLLKVYKEAIFNGDGKTVSEVEAIIQVIENEKTELVEKVSSASAEITSGKEKLIRLQADFDKGGSPVHKASPRAGVRGRVPPQGCNVGKPYPAFLQEAASRTRTRDHTVTRQQLNRCAKAFDNCRKRFDKERLTVRTDAQGEVIDSLLPMVDNFERARQYLKPETEKEKNIDASYQGIYKQFVEIMRSLDVAVVPTVGKPFDPSLHEAIAREESQELKEGIIIQEIRRGFLLGGRLLRPATVKVSSGPGSKKSPVATEKTTAGVEK